jgi:hypothetical protein
VTALSTGGGRRLPVAVPWFWRKSVASFIWAARLAATTGGVPEATGVPAAGPYVAEDGGGARILRRLQVRRIDRANGSTESRGVDVVVVLVQAIDGAREHAIARGGFTLRVVERVAAAP